MTAKDTTGASGSATFSWTVNPAGANTVTVTNPGGQSWTVGTAVSLQVQATDSASGQTLTYSATGLPAGLSISSSGLISGTPTAASSGSITVTAKDTTGASGSATFSFTVSAAGTGCTGQSNQPNFGPNVYIFNPSMGTTAINNQLNTIFNSQKVNQFGTQRYAELFDPGTYTGIEDNVGYYVSAQGLGQNPDRRRRSTATSRWTRSTARATPRRTSGARPRTWTITPSSGTDRWAVAQAAPFRRMDINGGLTLAPASNGYASGGYIADSEVTGQVVQRLPAAVVLTRQQLRQLERRGLEHGLLGRDRRAGGELPEPARDHSGHHAGLARRAVPLLSTPQACTTCSCRRCGPTRPAPSWAERPRPAPRSR